MVQTQYIILEIDVETRDIRHERRHEVKSVDFASAYKQRRILVACTHRLISVCCSLFEN